MSSLIVVDTSVFINYLRGADDDVFAILALNNQILLSPIVRLELMAGVRKTEYKIVERLCNALRAIDNFATPTACEGLLNRARGSGLMGGIPDLLIIADTIRHNASLFSHDEKMNTLAQKLGAPLLEPYTILT